MVDFSIHPESRLGPVHLIVSDLERAQHFYTDLLGFRLLRRREGQLTVGAGVRVPLLTLSSLPDARPRPPRTAGLYHLAVLLPSRRDLARVYRHLTELRYPLQGASDHRVSEALYLADPDGNGLEIYADLPREVWPWQDGQLQMATAPLRVDELMEELKDDDRPWGHLPSGARIGHIHLQVSDLRRAEAFYRQVLGFGLVQRYGLNALFLSAGGYHHHIGLNTWAAAAMPPAPSDSVGLRHFTICLPGTEELNRLAGHIRESGVVYEQKAEGIFLRDPSGLGCRLVLTTLVAC